MFPLQYKPALALLCLNCKISTHNYIFQQTRTLSIPDRYRMTVGMNAKHQVSVELTATIYHLLYL